MQRTHLAAQKLFDDWASKAAYEALASDYLVNTVADAYAVQKDLQQLHVQKRGNIAGRKIALTSKAMQDMVGIDQPIAGAFFSNDILNSPGIVRASDFNRLGIEFELALELNDDLPPKPSEYSRQEAYDCIAGVRPAFELIEDRNADYSDLDPFTLIADNAWCAGVVLGEALTKWRDLDLGDIPSIVHQTGQSAEKTNTGAADPLGSLAWVLNHFSARGITLSKGEHVITGSAVRTRFPSVGDEFRYEVAGASVAVAVTR